MQGCSVPPGWSPAAEPRWLQHWGDTGNMGCPRAWLGAASVPVLPAEAARSTTTCQGFASSSLFLAAVNALQAETILPHVFVLINSENTD